MRNYEQIGTSHHDFARKSHLDLRSREAQQKTFEQKVLDPKSGYALLWPNATRADLAIVAREYAAIRRAGGIEAVLNEKSKKEKRPITVFRPSGGANFGPSDKKDWHVDFAIRQARDTISISAQKISPETPITPSLARKVMDSMPPSVRSHLTLYLVVALLLSACLGTNEGVSAQSPVGDNTEQPAPDPNADSNSSSYNQDAQAVAPSIAPRVEQPTSKSIEIQQIGGNEIMGTGSTISIVTTHEMSGTQNLTINRVDSSGNPYTNTLESPVKLLPQTTILLDMENIAIETDGDGAISVSLAIDAEGGPTTVTASIDQWNEIINSLKAAEGGVELKDLSSKINKALITSNTDKLEQQRQAELLDFNENGMVPETFANQENEELPIISWTGSASVRPEPTLESLRRRVIGETTEVTRLKVSVLEGTTYLFAQTLEPIDEKAASGKNPEATPAPVEQVTKVSPEGYSAVAAISWDSETGEWIISGTRFTSEAQLLLDQYNQTESALNNPAAEKQGGNIILTASETTEASKAAMAIELEAIQEVYNRVNDAEATIDAIADKNGRIKFILATEGGESKVVGVVDNDGKLVLGFNGADEVEEAINAIESALPEWSGGFKVENMQLKDGRLLELNTSERDLLDAVLTMAMYNQLNPEQYPTTPEQLASMLAQFTQTVSENNGKIQNFRVPVRTEKSGNRVPPYIQASDPVLLDLSKPIVFRQGATALIVGDELRLNETKYWQSIGVSADGSLVFIDNGDASPGDKIDGSPLTLASIALRTHTLMVATAIINQSPNYPELRDQSFIEVIADETGFLKENPSKDLEFGGIDRDFFVTVSGNTIDRSLFSPAE